MKNIAILVFIVVAANLKVTSQELPKFEKKIFTSPEGKIFYNRSLPIYFYVSTSPDAKSPSYLLNSETTPEYANPMYFDTEGLNTLRSPSAVDKVTREVVLPKRDVQFQMYADSKPPSTSIVFSKKKETIRNGIHYVSDSLSVTFKASDEMSGVENTYVSFDGNAYSTITDDIKLNSEKEYTLKYFSVDNTGNAENLKEAKFSVDKTSPTSKLNINGEKFDNVLCSNVKLEISATDNISGVKQIFISIDDSVFRTYKGAINTVLLSQNEHTLYYYTVDQVNNKEKINSYTFYVDRTPPKVIEEIMGKTFVTNGKEFSAGTSKLKITSFDNKAGVKDIFYSINNQAYIKYEKPVLLSGFKGNILLKSYAVDNVGNTSRNDAANSSKNSLPYIDLSGPWVSHSLLGSSFTNSDTTFISKKTKIRLDAKDTESGIQKIEYQIDSSDLMSYNSPFSIENEGFHHISSYGYDNTENLTKQVFGVLVDTTGPEIFERFSSLSTGTISLNDKLLYQYPSHTVVFISATDFKSGFDIMYYELNNQSVQPLIKPIKGFKTGKMNTIKVKAIDKLGNFTEKEIEFFIR